jgi:hypothetical protein
MRGMKTKGIVMIIRIWLTSAGAAEYYPSLPDSPSFNVGNPLTTAEALRAIRDGAECHIFVFDPDGGNSYRAFSRKVV